MKTIGTIDELNALCESSGSKLVVIDFYASWCGPCKFMAPKFEQMAQDLPGVVFAKVDIDKAKELTKKFSISSIPHFKFFKNKKEVGEIKGADEAALLQKIQELQ